MKVITIKEPYASLIINGYKEYEFRSWKTKYRGKILIQASQNADSKNLKKFEHLNLDFAKGEIIGEAEIDDCIKITDDFNKMLLDKNSLVYKINYKEGYAFHLKNVKKYKNRIKCKGKLGLWNYEGK